MASTDGAPRASTSLAPDAVRPWRHEAAFSDALYEWTQRAPWLAISAAAHLLLFFVLAAIPWEELRRRDEVVIQARLPPPPETFEPPPAEPEPEPLVDQDEVEPELQDTDPLESPEPSAEPTEHSLASLDPGEITGPAFATPIGLGPGASPKFGGRSGRPRGGKAIERALADGLDWLAAHQAPDGRWDADAFSAGCGRIGATVCGGPGNPAHDVGTTGLALLAFLGEGSTTGEGRYQGSVRRGVAWLLAQQDPDLGLVGERASREFLYDHAIATLALCEACVFTKNPLTRRAAQGAVRYAQAARNPYGAWRYDVPPAGDSDTSVTGWMVLALTSAKEAGLSVDPAALEGALAWLDEATDPATGRVGYDERGTLSSRTRANERFDPARGEAMTAVALLCRFFLHQDPSAVEVMQKHAALLARKPPAWDPGGAGVDMYYWYYGSYALFQTGGEPWRAWRAAMERAVVDSQRRDGDEKGSWDPVGPWGDSGGRVYSTALMVLCLEVYFRYGRILGAR